MTNSLIAPDLDLAADIRLHLAAQIAFDPVGRLDPVPETDQVVFSEFMDPRVAADASGAQRLERTGVPDSLDVGQSDFQPLFAGEVDTN